MTYTKTFVILTPWAETVPWECFIRETGCISLSHDHSPMAFDFCAVEDCDERLNPKEVCYAVTEMPHKESHPQWVCWRHVRPDSGPLSRWGAPGGQT